MKVNYQSITSKLFNNTKKLKQVTTIV